MAQTKLSLGDGAITGSFVPNDSAGDAPLTRVTGLVLPGNVVLATLTADGGVPLRFTGFLMHDACAPVIVAVEYRRP